MIRVPKTAEQVAKRLVRVGDLIVVYYADGLDSGIALETCNQHKANEKGRSIRYLSVTSEDIADTNGAVFEKLMPSYNALEEGSIHLADMKRAELVS